MRLAPDQAGGDTRMPALDDWEPLSPADVGSLFAGFPGAWRIAGGWAIDLFAGEPHRSHADIDIEIDRANLGTLHDALPGWLLYAAHGVTTPWHKGEPFPDDTTDIWCRRPGQPWELQLMTAYTDEREWLFKRDHRIRGLLSDRTVWLAGLPVLAPEIQLLYKSRLPNRPKDERDFTHALPFLDPDRRTRLAGWLRLMYGQHPWLDFLCAPR